MLMKVKWHDRLFSQIPNKEGKGCQTCTVGGRENDERRIIQQNAKQVCLVVCRLCFLKLAKCRTFNVVKRPNPLKADRHKNEL